MLEISLPQPIEHSTAVQNINESLGEPIEAARNHQTRDIQKTWNSGHPGGAIIEDPPEYAASNSPSSP
jgi:hypothetical protein